MSLNNQELTWQQSIGIDESHLLPFPDISNKHFLVNKSVINSLSCLLEKADKDGVSISIISGFRSFDRQLKIWNDKWLGYRPVYSRQGRPLNINKMSDIEKYKAIALWSAIPGLSRHHWGTDFDIFATQPISDGHQVELTPDEFESHGPCNQLNLWLDKNLLKLGFFRPYSQYKHGVSVEPWHVSHIDTSTKVLQNFNQKACRDYIEASDIKSSSFIKEQFEHYYQQYFCNITQPKFIGGI